MKEKHTTSRRHFIKKSAISAAVFSIVPRFVLGGTGYIPLNPRSNHLCQKQ